jgi:AraC-like DNA-binding protein
VRVVVVSALLRELLHHAVQAAPMRRDDASSAAVLDLLSALVDTAPTAVPLHLSIPSDERAAAVAACLLEDPALDLSTACGAGAASRRTVERLFVQATGLSLGAWRQQARVLRAVQLLADGRSPARVAHSVGYSSQSAFGVAFREHLGTSPARFVRDLGVPVPTVVATGDAAPVAQQLPR